MKIKTALVTILGFLILPFLSVFAFDLPEQTRTVVVNARITIDYFSTLTLNPVTVERYQPSTVTIKILGPDGTPIPGRTVVIVAPGLNINQPTSPTNSQGITSGSVYSSVPGTYTVCAIDTTFGYDIQIMNCKTLYVIPVPIPTFLPEPYYTKGTTNTVFWNNLGSGYEYYVEVSEDSDFNTVLSNSGWGSNTSYQFTGLENEKMYFYRVKAKNPYGGESAWSSPVFSVQDTLPPEITTIDLGDIEDNDTVDWDPNHAMQLVFRVTDNLQLDITTFLCVNSGGNTYTCVTDSYMEGDNLIVNLELRDLERISGTYLRPRYEFCVEASDVAGNIVRVCNIYIVIPPGEQVPVPPIVERIEKVIDDINEIIDDTIGELDPVDLERVTTATSIVTLTAVTLLTIGTLLNLPYFLLQFIFNLLSWLGFRAGAKPLGYVYDAITKDPIAQAVVRIFNEEKKIVWSDVTNSKGYFSARLDSGKYTIQVRAVNYIYPSTIIFGREDFPLTNVYHGEQFEKNDNTELNFSIPLDPVEVSKFKIWREILWGRVKNILSILQVLLFIIGLFLAIYMYSRNPYWLTALVLVLYIPSSLLTLRNVFGKRERYGIVKDIEGNPVEGLVIGLRETEFDKVTLKRVTDRYGRYRMLVDSGSFILEVLDTSFKVESIEDGNEILSEKDEQWIVKDIIVSRLEKS